MRAATGQKSPTLRELHHGIVPSAGPPAAAPKSYRWIDDDPELSPRKPRAEVPLSAWS